MRISAKADYAVRAAVELAAAPDQGQMKGDRLASAQGIPIKFLENILVDLRQAGLIRSRRGPDGGYRLARSAADITIADIVRAAEGPLASVHDEKPEELSYPGPAGPLREVWVALRASMRDVLESVTLADLVNGELPDAVKQHLASPDAWQRR